MPSVEYTQSKGLFQKSSSKDASGNILPELQLKGTLFGHRAKIKNVTGATQLTAEDSGSVVLITPANADYAITLPDLTTIHLDEGLKYTFILAKSLVNGEADNNNITINQADAADDFKGTITSAVSNNGVIANNEGTIIFAKAAGAGGGDIRALVGDHVECVSTSANEWYVSGASQKAAAVIFA